MIVVSPHLDDAVFSCCALLAERPETTIVTICAGLPGSSTPPHQFDRAAGFETAAEAMEARRREDTLAGRALGVTTTHYSCLEEMYGPDDRIADAVAAALSVVRPGETVLGPLGLRHPDHEAVARTFCVLARERELNAWLYSELPYAVAWPEYSEAALQAAGVKGDAFTISADVGAKRAAVACYESQLAGMDIDALFGTERYYPLRGDSDL